MVDDDDDDKFPYGSLETFWESLKILVEIAAYDTSAKGMTEKVDEKYGIDYEKIINEVISEVLFHEAESYSLEESSQTIRDLFTDSEPLFGLETHSLLNSLNSDMPTDFSNMDINDK
ncbi:hypothetical protein D917_09475 [Trichinella nativa]|uniref:Uncharacterized protein n=1 Tax=Trichinella nativa TaxID=6335 RepID=A0A1Y3EJ51_9BILA|nr:hypothetical protein D917_09475 [Trichinella nativa]